MYLLSLWTATYSLYGEVFLTCSMVNQTMPIEIDEQTMVLVAMLQKAVMVSNPKALINLFVSKYYMHPKLYDKSWLMGEFMGHLSLRISI